MNPDATHKLLDEYHDLEIQELEIDALITSLEFKRQLIIDRKQALYATLGLTALRPQANKLTDENWYY